MITAQEIMEKYPRLYDSGVRCGFSCPEGWLHLVDLLSTNLSFLLDTKVPKDKSFEIVVDQVKEKFGGLRYYVFYRYDEDDLELAKLAEYFDGIIRFAESISTSMCQVCGSPANKVVNGGIVSAACSKHSSFGDYPAQNKRKGSVALDFDGVINSYSSGFVGIDNLPDPPVEGAIDFIQELVDYGFKVYVYSTRNEQERGRRAISEYLLNHGLPEEYHEKIGIVAGKPKAKIYLDDRAWEFTGEFPTPHEIDHFLPWTKRVSSTQVD